MAATNVRYAVRYIPDGSYVCSYYATSGAPIKLYSKIGSAKAAISTRCRRWYMYTDDPTIIASNYEIVIFDFVETGTISYTPERKER